MDLLNVLNGRKTYGIGAALLLYILIQYFNKQPVNMEIVMGGLAAMGLTIRHAVSHEVEQGIKPFIRDDETKTEG